tara:strand:- start:9529 stop:10605 length:1077 start_codon:yes stop_codon:yes gene_type:complete
MSAAPPRIEFRHLKPLMQGELMSLLHEWGLTAQGRRDGKYFVCPNPQRGDDRAGSFKIWLSGPAAGCFKEFDSGGAETGDIINLPVYAGVFKDRSEVYDWAIHRYGFADGDASAVAQKIERAEAASRKVEAGEAEERARKIRHAQNLFNAAAFISVNSRPWRYFTEARGLAIGQLPHHPSDLRVAHRCLYRDEAGEQYLPAMIAAMREAGGEIVAVHRTYLTPSDQAVAKAAVGSPKKMLGATRAAAIRVWPGAAPEEARHLILTEGIEDALACALAMPEARVHACGSLNGLMSWDAPRDEVRPSRLTVMADNDWAHGPAARAFDKAVARLSETKIPLAVARVPLGKDANDFIKGESR